MTQKEFLVNKAEVKRVTKYEICQTERISHFNKPVCVN